MQTKIVVSDTRLIIVDHAESKVVCLAVSVAAQCLARVLGAQGLMSRTVEIDPNRPLFDLEVIDSDLAKQGIAGFLDTVHKVSKEYPDQILVSDCRSGAPDVHRPDPVEEDETVESFAEMVMRPSVLTDSQGRPLSAAA